MAARHPSPLPKPAPALGALMLDVAARTDPPTAEQQERIDAASKGNIELGLPTKEESQ